MAQASKATEQVGKGADQAAKQADTAMGRMVQSAQNNREAWTTAGTTLTAFGAASLGALGLATKAAMDWESAFAGVRKTVDASEAEFAALEQGLRGMARELPASHQEIAAVAEAAGQLGIETPNILGFTRTMVDMGVATNMSSEEAATALARFMNVMGTSQADVGRLGATVVGLGNNFATTESEIVQMSQRLAGAGAQAGLTEGDVMGIATAMSSVGIEAEAGGSAMSQTMKRIGKAVDEGGDSLELFAQVSGMSAEQFAAAWRENPAMALDAFINGLSGVESQGMTTNGVLTELGITGIRESDALLRLSAAADQGADGMSLLATAIQMGNDEFDKGSALIEEAAQRYETAESKIQMAKNALVDAGISIGGVVLPAVADLAGRVGELAGWFADLPGPVHGAIGALGGIAGAGSLVAGSFLLIFPRVMETVQAFKTLRADMPGVASGLGKVGKAAGVAAAGIAVLNVAGSVGESFRDGAEQADLLAAQLLNLSASGDVTAESINGLVSSTVPFGVSVHGVGDALSMIDTDPVSAGIEGLTKTLLGVPTTVDVATESLSSLDGALVTLVNGGHMEQFSASFAQAVEDAEAYGFTAEELVAQLPELQAALTPVATEMGLTADNATLARLALEGVDPAVLAAANGMDEGAVAAEGFEEGMDGVEESTESATEAVEGMLESLSGIANAFLGARDAARDYEDSLEAANEAADENGKHWEDGTDKARENAEAIDELAGSIIANAEAMSANGEASGEWLKAQREDLIEVAISMGATREEAEAYADSLGLVPEEIDTLIELDTQQARDEWNDLWDELGYHPPEVPVTADTDPAEEEVTQFSGLVGDMPPGEVGVGADTSQAQEEVTIWGSQVGDVPTSDVPVHADIEPAAADVFRLETTIENAGGTVTINGNSTPGDQVLSTLMAEINAGDGTVTIDGQSYPADQALAAAVEAINRGEGTVTIEGNNKPANDATDSAKRHADGSTGTIDVDANTGGAESDINSTARDRSSNVNQTASTSAAESQLNRTARNRTSRITVFQSVRTSGSATARAMGGPVYGPGTGTSDSIPALLSNGEHVITAKEVAQAGGQDAIYRMREAIRSGFKFAEGGAVERGGYAVSRSMAPVPRTQAQSVSASVDSGVIASAVRAGFESATVIAQVSDRVAANLYQRGASASRAFGGAR